MPGTFGTFSNDIIVFTVRIVIAVIYCISCILYGDLNALVS